MSVGAMRAPLLLASLALVLAAVAVGCVGGAGYEDETFANDASSAPISGSVSRARARCAKRFVPLICRRSENPSATTIIIALNIEAAATTMTIIAVRSEVANAANRVCDRRLAVAATFASTHATTTSFRDERL